MIKFTESEIQKYLWSERDRWHDFFIPMEIPDLDLGEDLENLSAGKILASLTYRKLQQNFDLAQGIELVGVEVPLDKEGDSIIRADFLGVSTDSPGVAIIELKKSKQTERESFTELLAYSSHINSLFPTHCTADTILVLIAPMEVRIVREAFLQSLLFDRKSVVAFSLFFEDDDLIETIKLKPFIPTEKELLSLSEVAFSKRNFDVVVQVWEDDPSHWNPTKEERSLKPYQSENMNRVSAHAAQMMEAGKIHGFTYTQQAWPELSDMLPFTNSLVMVGFNPYKITNDQYYEREYPDIRLSEIPALSESGPTLADYIKGLKKSDGEIHDDTNYIAHLDMVWNSHLYRIARQVVDAVTQSIYKQQLFKDSGSMDWAQYEQSFIENVACTNFDVRPTGILRELYFEVVKMDLTCWRERDDHPVQGDTFPWGVEVLASLGFFSEFLDRMLGNPHGLGDD